ncbi:MAG TPA: HNH endonuclease [Thermoplasmata archaeon]|nr:HNH endonuclease [Thermoplasmata archaeon]
MDGFHSGPSLSPRRIIRDSLRWAGSGAEERRQARLARQCVECHRELSSRRTPYCSAQCRWKFHGRFFWDAARVVVLRRDRYTCQACGRRARRRELEVDHVVEVARGGPALEYSNLQTLCRACHRVKTSRFLHERARANRSGGEWGTIPDEPEWFPA